MAPYTQTKHSTAVAALATQVTAYHASRTPFRINHGSTHATRMRPPGTPELVITHLNHILSIDRASKTAIVEPNVKLGDLLTAAQPHGLMPPILMDFPDLTVGGGFSGASGESMCWREGLFDSCVVEVEIILGNGDVVVARRGGQNAELFEAARCSLGTFGVITLVTMRLREATDSVIVEYERVGSVSEMRERLTSMCEREEPGFEYVEGLMYSKSDGVILTARHVEASSEEAQALPKNRFDRVTDEWCYIHARSAAGGRKEVVPMRSYLFRWDRGAFWGGDSVFAYFGLPNNRFTRMLLDKLCNARSIYKAQLSTGSVEFAVIQDLIVPPEASEALVDYVDKELGIWPLWVTPVRNLAGDSNVWGHPFWKEKPGEQAAGLESKKGNLFLDWGVWGACDGEPTAFNRINRALEKKLKELRGMKLIYAASFYTEDEFWDLYDRQGYEDARKKWKAETLPTVWDKIRREPLRTKEEIEAEGRKPLTLKERILWVWPLGGLYQVFCILFR